MLKGVTVQGKYIPAERMTYLSMKGGKVKIKYVPNALSEEKTIKENFKNVKFVDGD